MKKGNPKKVSKRRGGRGSDVTKPRFTTEQIEGAIRDSLGCVAIAARKVLKCDRTTLYLYMKRDPLLKGVLDKARVDYKDTCQELARDNHLKRLLAGEPGSTAYELAKLEPKPQGAAIDTSKYTEEELILLKRLLDKGRTDGRTDAPI